MRDFTGVPWYTFYSASEKHTEDGVLVDGDSEVGDGQLPTRSEIKHGNFLGNQ